MENFVSLQIGNIFCEGFVYVHAFITNLPVLHSNNVHSEIDHTTMKDPQLALFPNPTVYMLLWLLYVSYGC